MKLTSQPEITAGDEFIRARRQLIMDDRFVYFGTLAMYMPFIPDPTVKTACVNNVCLRYNLEYVKSLKPEIRRSLVGHELMHPAFGQLWRREGRDLELWNIACDYKVNQALVQSGMPIMDNWYHDTKYYQYSAEQIYSLLQQQKQKQKQQQQQQNKSQGGGSGKPQDPGGQNTPGKSNQPSQASGKPDPSSNKPGSQPGNGPGNSGQPGQQPGAPGGNGPGGSQPQMGEPGSGDPGFDNPTGSFTDPIEGGMGDGAENMGQSDWKMIAQQAASAAKRAGNLPGGLEEALVASREAQVPWEEELIDFFTRTIPNDQTWGNPNRRFIGDGLHLPGKYNKNLGRIAGGMDTSGSLTRPMLDDIASEMTGIISEMHPESFDLAHIDTEVRHVDHFEPGDEVELVAKGRGGTHFKPFFTWVEKEFDEPPVCAIYFTDGENYDKLTADDEPGYPVLWCTADYVTWIPPFGQVLRIPNAH